MNASTTPTPFLAATASTGLTVNQTALAFTNTTASDPNAIAIPDMCNLSWLTLELTSIVTAANLATCYLSVDAAGAVPITDDLGTGTPPPIVFDPADATQGGVAMRIELPYRRPSSGVVGTIYLQVALDAGTATCTGRLWGQLLFGRTS